MRKFINPIELLDLQSFSLEQIDDSVLKKAKKKILAEMELSGHDFYQFNSIEVSRSDIENIFLELENNTIIKFYQKIYKYRDVHDFLTKGDFRIFRFPEILDNFRDEEFINFISGYFASVYNDSLLIALKNRNISLFNDIISLKPLVKSTDLDNAYKGVTAYFKEKITRADLKTTQIKESPSEFNKNKTKFLIQWVKAEFNIDLINSLPEYFQGLRSQIAKSLRNLAVNVYNKLNDINVSYEIIDYIFDIETDSMTSQTISKDYDTISDIKEKNKYSLIKERYYSVIENFIYNLETLGDKKSSPDFIKKFISVNIDIDEINKIIGVDLDTKDAIASLIRQAAIICWNIYNDLDTAILLINKAISINSSEEVQQKLNNDKNDLERIFRMRNHSDGLSSYSYSNIMSAQSEKPIGRRIKEPPKLYTFKGCGTKIYADTLYLVLFLIPIIPIRRYILEKAVDGSYRFKALLPLKTGQVIWNFILGLVGFITFVSILGNLTNKNSSHLNSKYNVAQEEVDKYLYNSLENGATPYNDIFGVGQYSSNSWINITNNNEHDVIVCLVDSYSDLTIRHAYIKSGSSLNLSSIPGGQYFIRAAFGQGWNPNVTIGSYNCGNFAKNYFYKQLYRTSKPITIENEGDYYTYGNITIPSDINRYRNVESISESEFFKSWRSIY